MKKQVYILFLFSVCILFGSRLIAQEISAGVHHSLFLCSNSVPMGCGSNANGVLGDTTTIDTITTTSVQSILSGIIAVIAGWNNSFFLKSDGTVWASGLNRFGALGDGTDSIQAIPILIGSLSGIISISATNDFTLFLKNDGTVWACGWNGFGQLGDGTTIDKWIPFQIPSLSGITAVATGWQHSLFLKNDGTVWACGRNCYGFLGDGTIDLFRNSQRDIEK